jgi:hypothetical protein
MIRFAPLAAPLLAAGSATAFALHRIARTPFTPYGDFGAAHLEHQVRLTAALSWRETAGLGLWDRLVAADGQYPPILHLLTLPASAWTGYAVEDIAWTGLVWLALLACAVAACAWAITRSVPATSAAATLVFLWPVGPAVATRYYYDLPLTVVLWTAAAVALAGWDGASPLDRTLRGARRAGAQLALVLPAAVTVGVLVAASCGFKWTALAFAPILVGAAFICPVHRDVRRWRLPVRCLALIVATSVGSLLVWTAAAALDPTSSLSATFNDMWPGVGDALYTDEGAFAPLAALGAMPGGEDGGWFKPGLVFYPLTLFSAVLSPLFAAALGGPLLHWARRDRRGAPFVAVVVGGQFLLLALVIAKLDERFLLTLAPGVLLAAAIGWSSLDEARRRRWGAIAVGAALLVSADFHYGRDLVWSTPIVVRIPGADPVTVRGIGLSDSWEQRGWARLDSQVPSRMQARRMLWALMLQCGFGPAALRQAPAGSAPFGERHWIEYRSLLDALGAGAVPQIDDCEPWLSILAGVDRGDVVDRRLIQRSAIEVLDGDERLHRVHLRGCVSQVFPDEEPSALSSSAILRLERDAPRCLRIFLDRAGAPG